MHTVAIQEIVVSNVIQSPLSCATFTVAQETRKARLPVHTGDRKPQWQAGGEERCLPLSSLPLTQMNLKSVHGRPVQSQPRAQGATTWNRCISMTTFCFHNDCHLPLHKETPQNAQATSIDFSASSTPKRGPQHCRQAWLSSVELIGQSTRGRDESSCLVCIIRLTCQENGNSKNDRKA